MAKLNRESKLRDRRAEKEARKVARKLTAASDARSEPVSRQEQLGIIVAEVDAGVPDEAESTPDGAASVPTSASSS
jgi:hypothetical protein